MFDQFKGRKLYRQPADAILFGVSAGLADFLQMDVVFVRLALVLLAILTNGWPILLAYVAAIVLMPINPAQDTVASDQEPKDVTSSAGSGKASQDEEKMGSTERIEDTEQVERMDSDQNM